MRKAIVTLLTVLLPITLGAGLLVDTNYLILVGVETIILIVLKVKLPQVHLSSSAGGSMKKWLLVVPVLVVVCYGLFIDTTTALWILGIGGIVWLILRRKRTPSPSGSSTESSEGSGGAAAEWVDIPLAKRFPRPLHLNLKYLLLAQMQINPKRKQIRFRQTWNRVFGQRGEEWITVGWKWNLDTNQPELVSAAFIKALLWWAFGLTELVLTPAGGGGKEIRTVVGLNTMTVIRNYESQFESQSSSTGRSRHRKKNKKRTAGKE